jgi:glycosyltransferase involved in cell wall biosynthesis
MVNHPLFSIVIPTRNRAQLLPNALQSALEQTKNDYEIIVSDNNSTPETEQVVRRLGDSRVRYVRVDRTLAMPDSWEFAVSHARGEYITILSDDDALSPTLLERLDQLLKDKPVKLISWIRYLYVMNDWYVEPERNKLYLGLVSGRAEERSSEVMLRQWFDGCTYYSQAPMLFNACCHRSIIEGIKKKAGRLFLGAAPDIASSLALLSEIPSFTFVDDVFSLAGSGKQSIGANSMHGRGGVFQDFITELNHDDYPRGPFKAVMLTTAVADTLLRVKEALPVALADYDINWSNYFIGCYKDLAEYERAGGLSPADISRERNQLVKLVSKQPPSIQLEFLHFVMSHEGSGDAMSNHRSQLWRLALKQRTGIKLEFLRFATGIRHQKNNRKLEAPGNSSQSTLSAAGNPYAISGAEAGFTNILECARLLDSFVSSIKRGESPNPNQASVASGM